MKTLDFKAVPVQDIDGKTDTFDISQSIGNFLYHNTTDIGEMDLARKIYHKGVIELSDQEIAHMRYTITNSPDLFAKIRVAVLTLLDQNSSNH